MRQVETSGPLRARRDLIECALADDEVIVYDPETHEAHCLTAIAASVFRSCDGTRSLDELAALLPAAVPGALSRANTVQLVVDELRARGLLETDETAPAVEAPRPTRAQFARRFGAAAAAVLFVESLVAPTAAQAATCAGTGASCASRPCCAGCTCVAGVCVGAC